MATEHVRVAELVNCEGRSFKFYRAAVGPRNTVLQWGAIGANGQHKIHHLDEVTGQALADAMLEQKNRKGYLARLDGTAANRVTFAAVELPAAGGVDPGAAWTKAVEDHILTKAPAGAADWQWVAVGSGFPYAMYPHADPRTWPLGAELLARHGQMARSSDSMYAIGLLPTDTVAFARIHCPNLWAGPTVEDPGSERDRSELAHVAANFYKVTDKRNWMNGLDDAVDTAHAALF